MHPISQLQHRFSPPNLWIWGKTIGMRFLSIVFSWVLIFFLTLPPAMADEFAGFSFSPARPSEEWRVERSDNVRKYSALKVHDYRNNTERPVSGFCGVTIFKPVRVPPTEFLDWFKDRLTTFLTNFSEETQADDAKGGRIFDETADYVATVEGEVRELAHGAAFSINNQWVGAAVFFATNIRDRVHYAEYRCQDPKAHDVDFDKFMTMLKDGFIQPAGYHNDWPPEESGPGSAATSRAQCYSRCGGPYPDLMLSCQLKCRKTFTE